MGPCRLRVYYGPHEDTAPVENRIGSYVTEPERVTVALEDILPILADAVRSKRKWVNDFLDEEITVSADLYEVLMAYRHLRTPSA